MPAVVKIRLPAGVGAIERTVFVWVACDHDYNLLNMWEFMMSLRYEIILM